MTKVNTGTVFRAAFAGCIAFATKFGAIAKAGGGAAKGLAGLVAADLLRGRAEVVVLEARDRVGGRVSPSEPRDLHRSVYCA